MTGRTGAGVQKTPNGRWMARYRDAEHKQHAKTFDRKFDAVAWRGEQLAQLRSGTWIAPHADKSTFLKFAQTWLKNKETKNLKPSTVESYRELLRNRVGPKWNQVSVGKISVEGVDAWTRSLIAEGLSSSRIHKAQLVLRQVLDLAVIERAIATNPVVTKKIHRPRNRKSDPRAFTPDEAKQLIALLPEKYKLLTEFLCFTGLRMGEVISLRVSDLNFGTKTLKVSRASVTVLGAVIEDLPKSGKSRDVPLTDALCERLRLHVADMRKSDWLFQNADQTQLVADSFRGSFKKAVVELGRPDMTPHNLRDTYASWAISAGVPLPVVSQSLGHANAAITLNFYAAFFPSDYDKLRDALSKIVI
jgi:integrase